MSNGTKFPLVASLIIIALAFFCLVIGVIAFSASLTEISAHGLKALHHFPIMFMQFILGIFGIIVFAFGLASSILALRRRHFKISLIGACLILIWSILINYHIAYFVPYYERFEGFVIAIPITMFSILGIAFLITSKSEFS